MENCNELRNIKSLPACTLNGEWTPLVDKEKMMLLNGNWSGRDTYIPSTEKDRIKTGRFKSDKII